MPRHSAGPIGTMPDGSINPLSLAVRAGDFVFVSGLMAKDESGLIVAGDITAQTDVVMARLARVLGEAGCTMADVVKCTVWLTDPDDFIAFNAAYQRHFSAPFPARATVRADLLLPGARIELEAVCYAPVP